MNPSREELIFALALTKSESDRAAFLDGVCAGDPVLRLRLENLLAAHYKPEAMSGLSAEPERATIKLGLSGNPPDEALGQTVGRYKLLERVGEGGCGVVYVAEQTEPVRRRVALKVIKLGMDTKAVVARFEAERQALAMMDHPNIAKVLDAGTTETGRPYFIIELVRGIKITDYCDQNNLRTGERLDLFIQVCQAIQHAHQKGIIHRDIKPSNILVTLHDGVPVPKVIDFGIAKATEGRLTDSTVYTQLHQFIGTPAYMSPEQAEMSGLDIDTRSDIYSLGVLLYELLTGRTPFDANELVSQGIDVMRKIIREQEPVRPSTRFATLKGDELTTTARRRSAEVPRLIHLLRGDLDWIVMKCLEKDRTRRYETANGLVADLKRHLTNQPVVARPPSAAYKFQKAWRRNKVAFTAAIAIAAALLVGTVVSVWQATVARRAQYAAQRAALAEAQQRDEAQRERDSANAARTQAQDQRRVADDARRRSDAETYAADISLAQKALETYNVSQARELLRRHFPRPGAKDLRGWEWRYLWQKSRGDAPQKLFVQTNLALAAAVSADGRWLAIVSYPGGDLAILDISNPNAPHQVATVPSGGTPTFDCLAISPVEPLLAWGCYDDWSGTNSHRVHLWNFQTQTNLATLQFDTANISLAFSPDGKKLLTRTSKQREASELILWSCQDGALLERYPAFGSGAQGLGVTPDFTVAVYGGQSNTIHAFDLIGGTNRWMAKLPNPESKLGFVAISPDGQLAASSEGAHQPVLRLWDVATGREIASQPSGHLGSIPMLRFLLDGRTLVSAGEDQTIRLWDVSEPGTLRAKGRPLLGQGGVVSSIVAMPDRRSFISTSGDGSVYLWDSSREFRDDSELVVSGVRDFEFATDSKSVFTVEQTNRVMQREGPDFRAAHLFDLPGNDKRNAAISRDGYLVAPTTNGLLQLYDLKERRLVREFGNYGPGVGISLPAFPVGRKRLLVVTSLKQRCDEWDLETFQSKPLNQGAEQETFNLSNRGEWLLKTDFDGSVTLTLVQSQTSTTRNLGLGPVMGGVFSDDGRWFAVSSWLGSVQVWETASFQLVATVGHHVPMWVNGFSPDGTRLLTLGQLSGVLQLWDLETSRELLALPHGGGGFSPDGNILAQIDESNTLRIYRVPTLQEIDAAEAKSNTAARP
jgi:serine/threonine protein kinase/WD40 repeat protein